jgi:predicted metal-binding protein
MSDSIEYEIVKFESREVWKCAGQCGRFRHRRSVSGILPAVCCQAPARLIDRYEQPIRELETSVLEQTP